MEEIFFLALVCALASVFLSDIKEPGMLLSAWGRLLDRMANSRSPIARALSKPLGNCIWCFTPWVSLAAMGVMCAFGRCPVAEAWLLAPAAAAALAAMAMEVIGRD
jgi:hypothetical protein